MIIANLRELKQTDTDLDTDLICLSGFHAGGF